MIDSLYYSSRGVQKLFCGLQNELRKALLFITKDLNGPSVFNTSLCMEAVNKNFKSLIILRVRGDMYKSQFWIISIEPMRTLW